MLWFASWLSGREGEEGPWFYSGRGGEADSYTVPANATGLRVRRWPNEGLDAEYADVMRTGPLAAVVAGQLDFDSPQPFSRLRFRSTQEESRA
jgi:hypothetical protein